MNLIIFVNYSKKFKKKIFKEIFLFLFDFFLEEEEERKETRDFIKMVDSRLQGVIYSLAQECGENVVDSGLVSVSANKFTLNVR